MKFVKHVNKPPMSKEEIYGILLISSSIHEKYGCISSTQCPKIATDFVSGQLLPSRICKSFDSYLIDQSILLTTAPITWMVSVNVKLVPFLVTCSVTPWKMLLTGDTEMCPCRAACFELTVTWVNLTYTLHKRKLCSLRMLILRTHPLFGISGRDTSQTGNTGMFSSISIYVSI